MAVADPVGTTNLVTGALIGTDSRDLRGRQSTSPTSVHVYQMGHGFEVSWPYAGRDAAEVVELAPVRYRPDLLLEHAPMSKDNASAHRHFPIAKLVAIVSPDPAWRPVTAILDGEVRLGNKKTHSVVAVDEPERLTLSLASRTVRSWRESRPLPATAFA